MTAFVPRVSYPQLDSLVRSYFLGHHRVGLQKMTQLVTSVDLIIECRDFRVPLSSRNPMFEKALSGKERLIVYTKRDLAGDALDNNTRTIIQQWHAPSRVMFSSVEDREDVKNIIKYAKGTAKVVDKLVGSRMLIVGMPNVGKSSLLNFMRRYSMGKGKAANTGAQPGVTRKLSTAVKISEDPLVYLIDSPGVFVPYIPSSETMLKLALVGCVKDTLVPLVTLADYMLYQINLHDPTVYSDYHPPTNNIIDLLTAVAKKTGKLLKGGEPALETAALWIVDRWRWGQLGKFILDEVDEGALARWIEEEENGPKSGNQLRKERKAAMLEAKATKRARATQDD